MNKMFSIYFYLLGMWLLWMFGHKDIMAPLACLWVSGILYSKNAEIGGDDDTHNTTK